MFVQTVGQVDPKALLSLHPADDQWLGEAPQQCREDDAPEEAAGTRCWSHGLLQAVQEHGSQGGEEAQEEAASAQGGPQTGFACAAWHNTADAHHAS